MAEIRIKNPWFHPKFPQAGGFADIAKRLNELGYKNDKFYKSFGYLVFIVSDEDKMAYKLTYGDDEQPTMWWEDE